MKRLFYVILSTLLFICFCKEVYAYDDIVFIYSDWVDYYPEGVESIRIESQDRYLWYKEEDGQSFETEDYYDYLEGYEKIEDSKKTFYRVINNEYIVINGNGELIKNFDYCRKVFCTKIYITPFVPKEEEPTPPDNPPDEEILINPDTFDPINTYIISFILCIFIIIVINSKRLKDNKA